MSWGRSAAWSPISRMGDDHAVVVLERGEQLDPAVADAAQRAA